MVKARYDRSGLMDRQGVVMNKLLLGSFAVALTMGGSAAMAADMPLKAPPPPVAFSWTGCYVGIEGGGAWGRSKHIPSQGPFANQDLTPWYDISCFLRRSGPPFTTQFRRPPPSPPHP